MAVTSTDGGTVTTTDAAAARAKARAAAVARQQAADRARALAAEAARRAAAQRQAELRQETEAKRLRAVEAARARAKEVADARHTAYQTLQARQAELLRQANIVRSPAPVVTDGMARAEREWKRATAVRQNAAVARQAAYDREHAWRKKDLLDNGGGLSDYEDLLREEAKRARSGQFDAENVSKLSEQYVKLAEQSTAKYKTMVHDINAALGAGDVATAKRLYQSPEFRALARDWERLYGNGQDPRADGTFSKFWSDYQSISEAQTAWWKRQTQAALDADRKEVNRLLKDALSDGDPQKIREYQQLAAVYAGQTGWVQDGENADGKPVYRRRTIEEELQYRDAMKRIEMERLRAQYDAELRREQMFARKDGLVPGLGGRYISPEQKTVEDLAAVVVAKDYGGNTPSLKRASDLADFADRIVSAWDKVNGGRLIAQGAAYSKTRSAFEKQVYAYFGSQPPEWWDRLFNLPGISHGLALLQGGTSAIGAASRVALKTVTGKSVFDVELSPQDIPLTPPAVRQAIRELADPGQLANTWNRKQRKYFEDWMGTDAGQAWAKGQYEQRQAASDKQDAEFAKRFYGNEDVGGKLEALNQYGSTPFRSDAQNLLFQLLSDPTNAIPLKFTTYLARGKFAAEMAGKTKFLGSTKFGMVRDFVAVDEGVLKLRSELDKVAKKLGAGVDARRLTEDMLAEVAGIANKADRVKAIEKALRDAGLDPKLVNDTQLMSLIEKTAVDRAKRLGIDYRPQSVIEKAKQAEAEAARAEKARLRAETAKRREVTQRAGLEKRKADAAAARERLAAAKRAEETRLAAAAKEKTVAEVGAPSVAGAARGATGRPSVPAKPLAPAVEAAPLLTRPVAKVERQLARTMRVQEPKSVRATSELRSIRRAGEYYRRDPLGNYLPNGSKVTSDARYRALVKAAENGDTAARAEVARLARQRRNLFRTAAEDQMHNSKFTMTDFDLAERAGVAGDKVAEANLLTDRETIRYLKRSAARGTTSVREHIRQFVRDPGRAIEHDITLDVGGDVTDSMTSASRVYVGDDILAAADSPRGVKDAYETFSGLPDRTRYYAGGIFDRIRDSTWRKRMLGPKRFGQLLDSLDQLDELTGVGGIASFRDGGQVLFELFHRLRLEGDMAKLKRLSQYAEAHLSALDDPADSLFGWMWKVMEERSAMPWAWDAALVEDGFMRAAERWNMHPNLALAMVPSGYYAHTAPNRFRLSSALLGIQDSPIFKAAPAAWVEKDALDAISATFAGKAAAGNATRIVHYAAERFGSFEKAFRLRNRLTDELTHAVRREMTPEGLADVLVEYADAMPGIRLFSEQTGTPLRDALMSELLRKPGAFPNGSPKRPVYPQVRAAVLKAYWAGRLTLSNPEGHKLMLLAHLQDNPKSWLDVTSQFIDRMTAIGAVADGKAFIRELFRDRIDRLGVRAATERLGLAARSVDPLTGEVIETGLTDEWRLWDQLGFTPDLDRVRAWLDNVQRGQRLADLDVTGANLGQFASEEELLRGLGGSALSYAGRLDAGELNLRVRASITAYRKSGEIAELADGVSALAEAVRQIHEGGLVGDVVDDIRETVEMLEKLPEARTVLSQLRDEVGNDTLATWLNLAGDRRYFDILNEAPAPPPKRAPEPRLATGEPPLRAVDLTPAATEHVARAQAALEAVTRMSESEWWKHLSEQSWKVLRSPEASREAKAAARRLLRDIQKAEFAKKRATHLKGFIPAAERTRFRRRVVALHGRAAEDLIAPKYIAPLAEDEVALRVEQSRTYWRTLKAASPTPATGVAGVKHGDEVIDHLPLDVYRELDKRISDAIAEVRGFRADLRTSARRAPGRFRKTEFPMGRMRDTDERVLAAKRKVLVEYARETGWKVSMVAYDEARKVLLRGHVQNRSAEWLLKRSREVTARFGGDFVETYKRLRAKEAKAEARRQLSALAWGEMYGHSPDEILAEFVARYSDDGQLRTFTPELSRFQRRTLEEHVKALSGVKDLANETEMGVWLSSRNTPPRTSRSAAREFLTHIGAWSPRRAEQFVTGATSWDIDAEAAYWRTNYGFVPDWANRELLANEMNDIFHDQTLYFAQMRAWGVFNRDAEVKLRLSGKTAAEIEEALLRGDPALGLKGKRELDLQRRYVMERYGDLVSDGGRLTAMPWLMYPDELRSYIAKRGSEALPEGLIASEKELDTVLGAIDTELDGLWEKYISPKAAAGPVMYEDIFKMAADVQARLLADPAWVRRYRDVFGTVLDGWASVNRALVFSQLSFATMNVVDAPIKGAWYRLTRRGLFNPGLHGASGAGRTLAETVTPQMLGLDAQTTIYRLKQRSPIEQMRSPVRRGWQGNVERALGAYRGFSEWAPALAGKAEVGMKVRLAQGMLPQVYDTALARLKDPDLARAFALRFTRDEIARMWPVSGDHPLERLFNRVVPFASYMVRNKVLFISEAVSHPSILNRIDYIGRYIEEHNRREWERKHPGEPMPDLYARRVELPWAPGYYLDLGQFSDATRGLKPIYQLAKGQSYKDFVAGWVRLINPSAQAGIYMLTNALGVTQRVQWQPIYNADGFLTGYEKVVTGWTEPWSKDQPSPSSIFWFVEAWEAASKLGATFSAGELSALVGKVALFDAISAPDRGSGLFELYKAMRDRNAETAQRWLTTTTDGAYLQAWLLSKREEPRDVADWLSLTMRWDADPKRWFHSQDPAFQTRVKAGYEAISSIRADYEARLLALTPGSAEAKATKAEMLFRISEVYRLTPELLTHEVYSKSASEWSAQLQSWQTSMKLDEFFALDDRRPVRADYATTAEYTSALDAWRHQKELFLATYPDVAQTLGRARDEVGRVRDQIEAEWDAVLNRVGARSEAIAAAKAAGENEKADLLYLANELDYSLLEKDYVALQWSEADFATLPKGVLGPPTLRDGAMKRVTQFLDFDRRRYDKAVREGRGEKFLADLHYAQGIKEVVLKAKGGDPFGKFDPAAFVRALKARPSLLAQYFERNPGKAASWKQNDAYATAIGSWGKLVRAQRWDEARRVWDGLPQWVKDRYYAKHPDRRAKAVQSAAYMGYMERWTAYFEKKDTKGGMDYFWSMPEWVRERYFAKHPDKRVKWEGELRFGQQLADYFAADPAMQARYLESHPDLKAWLLRNVSSTELNRQAILAAYGQIPKTDAWLKKVFREKYPEVFSEQAKGDQKLRRVYDKLAAHPEYLPAFEAWVKAVWANYTEMLKHPKSGPPKPLELKRQKVRTPR